MLQSALFLLLLQRTTARQQFLRTNVEPLQATKASPPLLQGTGNTGSCSWMITCQMCASSEGCGWCSDCGRCVEGGTTGPSSTNCMAWDYEQCSGPEKYADLALSSHEFELKERTRLVEEYRKERDRHVAALEEVAAMEEIVKKASQTESISKSVSDKDQSGDYALSTTKKATQDECDAAEATFKKSQTEKEETKKKQSEQKTMLATLEADRTQALETGSDDTTQADSVIAETQNLLTVTATKMQESQDKTTLDEKNRDDACNKAKQATVDDALHQGQVATAKAGVNGAATMLTAMEAGLQSKRAEAKRSKSRALEISAKLKALTKSLKALRKERTAQNSGAVDGCTVTNEQVMQAKDSIEEFEGCVDCQKKATEAA